MGREVEDFEAKTVYANTDKQRLDLIKTIVAMANTAGGQIVIRRVDCDLQLLDSARIDDMVNRCVQPRVRGIGSEFVLGQQVDIRTRESEDKPHVFVCEGVYHDKQHRQRTAFHPGQIWVRHSSKNATATADDLRRLIQEAAARLFERISREVRKPGVALRLAKAEGTPVRISSEPGALPVTPDLEHQYPYTTKTLGEELGRDTNWASAAAKTLALKDSRTYSLGIVGGRGDVVLWKYSHAARDRIREQLDAEPSWDPYHA